MKSGSLEAQRTPDLLFWLIFCIGTEGHVVPNEIVTMKLPKSDNTITFNPTEVILSSLASCLETVWYSRCEKWSRADDLNIQACFDMADTYYGRLHTIASILAGMSPFDLSTKRHMWRCHSIAFFITLAITKGMTQGLQNTATLTTRSCLIKQVNDISPI